MAIIDPNTTLASFFQCVPHTSVRFKHCLTMGLHYMSNNIPRPQCIQNLLHTDIVRKIIIVNINYAMSGGLLSNFVCNFNGALQRRNPIKSLCTYVP